MDRDETATTPDGSMPNLDDGDQHHDELANTDPDNHGAVTSAPVMGDTPQGIGWTEPGAEAGDAQATPKGVEDARQVEQPEQNSDDEPVEKSTRSRRRMPKA